MKLTTIIGVIILFILIGWIGGASVNEVITVLMGFVVGYLLGHAEK